MTQIDELLEISRTFNAGDIKQKLKEIVPEYPIFQLNQVYLTTSSSNCY
jgi:hypothetical protein